MSETNRHRIAMGVGALSIILLIGATVVQLPTRAMLLPGFFFSALIAFTTTFGIPFAGGYASLVSMTILAAYLVMGWVPAGWAVVIGLLFNGLFRYRWAEALNEPVRLSGRAMAGVTGANCAMFLLSLGAGAVAFERLGGLPSLQEAGPIDWLRLLALGLVYVVVNYLLAAGFIGLRGRAALRTYFRMIPHGVLVEGGPLIFAPLVALIYTRLGPVFFVLFASILVIASLITRSLDFTSRRLERRIQELNGLQAVGQALSRSLQIEEILNAVYTQVAKLMSAQDFFVALYDPETDEVSFPLAVEAGKVVKWRSRRRGNGLTEQVLRQRQPLLIRQDVSSQIRALKAQSIGREAACWLGVPILAGAEPLGVIAVQSYDTPRAYDLSHQEILVTIATQAAVAIQNARLYARTDEALSRRVQELGSILRTTREGILLLDLSWRVLAGNRALADLIGVAESELAGSAMEPAEGSETPLAALIGYSAEALPAECSGLIEKRLAQKQAVITVGATGRSVERTLTPVRNPDGAITSWLLLFRDITEEMELTRLREEMTGMLVHDLRSPLTVVMGSLALMKRASVREDAVRFEQLLGMARQSGERMLGLVNDLLDINKLESGQLPLNLETVAVAGVIQETVERLAPLAAEAKIDLITEIEPELPSLTADPQLMGRVFNNLLDNAIKFTPDEGRVRIWARVESTAEKPMLLVGVSDTGPGIPHEMQGRVFEKFQQVNGVQGRRRGSGLGLPFCKLVVEAHGGNIRLESAEGQGSTFVVVLPTTQGAGVG